VDGGNFNDNIVGGPVGLVPEDAIQEFRSLPTNFRRVWTFIGPFINVVTKWGRTPHMGRIPTVPTEEPASERILKRRSRT
jgi:hypothetical protein